MIIVDERTGALNQGVSTSRIRAPEDGSLAGHRDVARLAALVSVGTILFLIPAIWNGHPFLFPDSEHYFIIGRSILSGLARLSGASVAVSGGTVMADPSASSDTTGGLAAIAGGRSPVYALLLYVLSAKASVWWIIVLQSALVSWLIVTFLDLVCGMRRTGAVVASLGFLALVTSAGAFSGFLMPDIFAATFVLAALLLVFDTMATRIRTLAYAGVIALSLVMHATIALLAASTLVLIALCRPIPFACRLVRKESLLWIGGALILGLAFNTAYLRLAERVSGHPVGAPPYLMARVIADGPGRMLLAETCTTSDTPFAACAFAGQPFVDHNDFLWGSGSHGPNFSTSPPALRAALSVEEGRFVRAAFLRHPIDQLAASTRNALRQLLSVDLTEFVIGTHLLVDDAEFRTASILKEIPRLNHCVAQPGVCPTEAALLPTLQIGFGVNLLSFLAAIAVCGLYWAARPRLGDEVRARMDRLMLIGTGICILLLINAVACGAMSGPHDRYQARLVWLGALFMVALAVRSGALSKSRPAGKPVWQAIPRAETRNDLPA
jgi:hypothetical protein